MVKVFSLGLVEGNVRQDFDTASASGQGYDVRAWGGSGEPIQVCVEHAQAQLQLMQTFESVH